MDEDINEVKQKRNKSKMSHEGREEDTENELEHILTKLFNV